MSKQNYIAGQRWISNTESELGLGIVVDVANRRVEISFPASAERRTYAIENAPVSRVQYELGQVISDEQERSITVQDVIDNNGCLIYQGVDDNGEIVILPELDLNSFVQFSKPQDRLFAGQIDKNRTFQLRCQTLENLRHLQQSPVRGLLGARVQLLPHQLYIASEAANRYAPRVLLADEVGLGKTIEAGLILHQQLLSGSAQRVLIVVPDSLLHQWLVEMLRRFNLFFTILDEQRCLGLEELGDDDRDPFFDEPDATDEEAINPFDSAQLVLCTLSFMRDNQRRHRQAVAADWDLLIVDEAHHLEWQPQQPSPAYAAIEALSQKARGLLLLTATPEQLGVAGHFARLRLLDPDRYYDLERFIDEEKNHQPVNELVQHLLADNAVDELRNNTDIVAQAITILGAAPLADLQQALSDNEQSEQQLQALLASLVEQLLDRHGTGRVLFRNTRASVAGFPDRLLHQYPLLPPAEYLTALNNAATDQALAPESLLGANWLVADPRVEWLVAWLKQHRDDKILVICGPAQTALDLEEHLRLRHGVHSSVFHEGLSLVARDRSAAYFADDEEGAQVLICSEIGSEGRNFQFSHHLVLFDVPLNPDLLEQRIGRLDRIGQRHTVEIHTPYFADTAQAVLVQWLHEGINAFESTCPTGLALYKQFEQELNQCLADPGNAQILDQLVTQTRVAAAELAQVMQNGRDRLLELNSCNHDKAEAVVTAMVEEERRQELTSYMEQMFDLFGVEQEHHSAASVVLTPGDHMLTHHFPALPEDGVTATFSREIALSREDMQFISWEHPMVAGAMDMVLSGEFGNTAFCTLKLPPLKPGTVLLEAMFVLQASAPGTLQLQRHLPLTAIRIVVDSNNNDLSQVLTPAHLERLGQRVAKRSAQDLVQHARQQISTMITQAEGLADKQRQEIIHSATAQMLDEQQSELQRLGALAEVNANIRQEELAFLDQRAQQSSRYLQAAQLKLDAIRVALVVD